MINYIYILDLSDDVYGHSVEDYDISVSPGTGNLGLNAWRIGGCLCCHWKYCGYCSCLIDDCKSSYCDDCLLLCFCEVYQVWSNSRMSSLVKSNNPNLFKNESEFKGCYCIHEMQISGWVFRSLSSRMFSSSVAALVRNNLHDWLDTWDQNKRLNNRYCDFELKTIEAGTWQLLFSLLFWFWVLS